VSARHPSLISFHPVLSTSNEHQNDDNDGLSYYSFCQSQSTASYPQTGRKMTLHKTKKQVMILSIFILLQLIPISLSLSTFSPPSVLTIGDALFDCIANDDARGFTVDEMVKQSKWTAFPGGAPANVASACCKLGTSSAFCGCLGADQDGDELESLLLDIGVDVSLVQRTTNIQNRPTRRVMVTRSIEGDREFGGFYQNRAADEFADCHLDEILSVESNKELIANVKWIVCSTLSLAFPQSAKSIHSIVNHGLESGTRLYVDVNWRPVFWPNHPEIDARKEIFEFCQKANIVKLTDEEAEWLLQIPAEESLADPLRIHRDYFPNALGVLVTAGEKGAAYSLFPESGCIGMIEPFKVSVVETTGAGDAFTAGFLHALSSLDNVEGFLEDTSPSKERQETVQDMMRFAAAVGALTCTKEGAIASQPNISEVESFLIHGENLFA
jgi:fructokinase